jgi:hypothetical protein
MRSLVIKRKENVRPTLVGKKIASENGKGDFKDMPKVFSGMFVD